MAGNKTGAVGIEGAFNRARETIMGLAPEKLKRMEIHMEDALLRLNRREGQEEIVDRLQLHLEVVRSLIREAKSSEAVGSCSAMAA